MLDQPTKKRIDDCRDILVGKLPDPKSQIEQITIALIYKFMDDMDKEAMNLGGKAKFFTGDYAKYGWDKLFDPKIQSHEMLSLYSTAVESMNRNPNIPQLFRDIFKNAYLPYRDPETLKMFLKTIGEFEYTHSEKLGDAFEYLLSVMGSQGDAGQFRTPRHIIDFLVEVVNPGINDTVVDPACGTAGFLISAFKHILKQKKGQLTPDERKKLIKNFTGYDISPDMVRLSLVNLYLHGFSDPHISEYDTLSSDEKWDEYADVIMANPPFMSPKGGIRPHKRFSVQSNRSEVLFVDYIAEHLNPKGRAGIIVPEGIIFQSGTAYKDLRKMLVDNHLYAVVSLPSGVFNPYSGVKTSILLMDKEFAKTNDKILFVKVANDGYGLGAQRNAVKGGQLDDAIEIVNQFKIGTFSESEIAHAVQKSEIAKNGDYNLSVERYKSISELISEYELIPLSELTHLITKGTTPTSIGHAFTEKGINFIKIESVTEYGNFLKEKFNYISEDCNEKLSRSQLQENDVLFSIAGAFGRSAVVTSDILPANTNQALSIIRPNDKLLSRYLRAVLKSERVLELIETLKIGVAQYNLSLKQINELKIPLPPLSIQQEIVAEIEVYQKIIDGAKMVVENYKPKIDIDAKWKMVELGEICEIKAGGTPSRTNSKFWDGNVPWYSSGELNDIYTVEPNEKITEFGLQSSNASIFPKGSLLVGMYDTAAFKMSILDRDATFNQAVCGIRPNNQIDLYFLMLFFIMNKEYYLKHRIGVRQRNLNKGFISEIKIPKIPLEIQRQIVSEIEKEQELVNANKQLIEIFEQKIKDRIAKVWGK